MKGLKIVYILLAIGSTIEVFAIIGIANGLLFTTIPNTIIGFVVEAIGACIGLIGVGKSLEL